MILDILIGIILIVHGFYSLYASYKNKSLVALIFDSDFFIEKKILGPNFNKIFNFLFGIAEIVLGFIIVIP
jgi:hypothetical protein